MSVTELKKIVDEITPEERCFLKSYLAEAYPEDEAFESAELDRRMMEMDQGKHGTWEQLLKAHDDLKTQGV